MNSFTYFQQIKDEVGNTATATSGTGRKQTYNIAPEGKPAVASVRTRGPDSALMYGRWDGKLPNEQDFGYDLRDPVPTQGAQKPSPTPTGGVSAMVPKMNPATKGKSFL